MTTLLGRSGAIRVRVLGTVLVHALLVGCGGAVPVLPDTGMTPTAPSPTPSPIPTPTPIPVPPTRVMPLGDSITQASANRDSYRRPLWKSLQSSGYSVDFVGSLTENYLGGPPIRDFDTDHEGHWNWRTDEILGQIPGWARQHRPDVVLMHLGTNDVITGQSTSSTIAELEQIIDRVRDVNPGATVMVAQVIPTTTAAWNRGIDQLNAAIPSIASRKSTPQSVVLVVDQFSGFNAQTETYDGLHPNPSGETRMASRWHEALQRVLKPTAARSTRRVLE